MKKKPFYLPIAILITTLALGISVPAFFLANRSGQASFSTVDPTPTLQPNISIVIPPGRETTQDSLQNCTYHAYHWISQPEAWPAQVTLGGVTYTRADMLNLRDATQGDPAIDLIKEALIAIVNIYNGASQSRIENTLVEADKWLSDHQADGELSEFNQQQARSFTSALANYNNGRLYPTSCPDQIPLPVAELASEEATPTDPVASATASVDGNADSEDKQNGTFTTFQSTPTDAPPTPQPTGAPPARSTVKRPTDTPIAPPPQLPPDNPDKDNPGRGHGNDEGNPGRDNGKGNGNGNGNPGQGNQGQGNENRGQGNQGGGNGNEGHEDKDGGKDKPGPGKQASAKGGENDHPDQNIKAHGNGKGKDDPGNGDKGKGNEGGSGKGEGDKGRDKDKDKGDSGKDKDKDKGDSGKGNDKKGP